jgi:hypothetical protein
MCRSNAGSVAGEIFKAGVAITTADDGTGAIRIAAQVCRNLCKNLIIIDRASQTSVTRHVGQNLGQGRLEGCKHPRRRSGRAAHARTPGRGLTVTS